MPIDLTYERYLTPNGRKTMAGAVTQMREVGSSTLVQEHLIMRLAIDFKPVFAKYGADIDFFKRFFGVNPSTPPFSGSYRISSEMDELFQAATTKEGSERRKRAGPLHLLEATLWHSQGRLRTYLMHAGGLRNDVPYENIPEVFWEDISTQTKKPELSIVA